MRTTTRTTRRGRRAAAFPEEQPPPAGRRTRPSRPRRTPMSPAIRRIKAARAVERRMARRERTLRDQAAARAVPILRATAEASALHVVLDAARRRASSRCCARPSKSTARSTRGRRASRSKTSRPTWCASGPTRGSSTRSCARAGGSAGASSSKGRCRSAELRRHLRRFLMVEDESGEPLYFRYYDPGALRDFWPSCSRRQVTESPRPAPGVPRGGRAGRGAAPHGLPQD